MPARRRPAALLLAALALCLAVAPAARAQEGDDEPEYDVPAWAAAARDMVEAEEWDEALRALGALTPSRGNAFALHYLTAEAWLGKWGDANGPAGQRRALAAARASFARAQALAPATMRALMAQRLALVHRELAQLGAASARPDAAAASPTSQPPAPTASAPDAWRAGQRVEAYVDGAWTGGTVLRAGEGAEAGQVRVSLDGYTYGVSRIEWVPAARVRRLAATPRAAPPTAGAPAALPLGTYTCTSFATSGSRMTLGRIVVRGGGTYEWRTLSGAGRPGRYRYDPASGRIEWADGLPGFFGVVGASSVYREQSSGAPTLRVQYQARAGGNHFDMDCAREGT